MTDLTPAEIAEIEKRFEDFNPEAATHYGPEDDLPADILLTQAQAARAYHQLRADQVMKQAIDAARAQGLSWHTIGLKLGVTGEAVRQRYSRA